MKFHPLASVTIENTVLEPEYKNGREVGIIKLGESALFFRKHLKVYYIPYTEVTRCFRRVLSVPAKLCCGKGDFAIENLVIYAGENEIAQIQLPGTKAAKILIEELKEKIPHAQFSRPEERVEECSEGCCNDTK